MTCRSPTSFACGPRGVKLGNHVLDSMKSAKGEGYLCFQRLSEADARSDNSTYAMLHKNKMLACALEKISESDDPSDNFELRIVERENQKERVRPYSFDSVMECEFPPARGKRGFVTANKDDKRLILLTDETTQRAARPRAFFNWDQPSLLPPPQPPREPATTPQPPPPPPPEPMPAPGFASDEDDDDDADGDREPTPGVATDYDDDDGDRDPCKVEGLRALLEETIVDELIVNEKLVFAMDFCSAEGAHSVADIIEFDLGDDFVSAIEPLRRVPKKKLLNALQVIVVSRR